ncbi:MAG: acyl-homoserine-lactone synthase [Rhizobiaceae bacterium]
MIVYVTPTDRLSHHGQINEYFKLRKKIFCEKLNWATPKPFGLEYDEYDDLFNIYILYLDEDSKQLVGGVRFMPTNGPTATQSALAGQPQNRAKCVSPHIWEASKFCALRSKAEQHAEGIVNRAALALSLASIDFCQANDIRQIVGICDKNFISMAESFGVSGDVISSFSDDQQDQRYCCIWPARADADMLAWSKRFLRSGGPPILRQVVLGQRANFKMNSCTGLPGTAA